MLILVFKTLHVISVIIWMGVLLYMPRLFIYQTEANNKTEPDRSILINQYKLMAKRLWVRVGWPSMGLAVIFGLGIMHPYFASVWFWVKMGFVVALIGYHHMIHFANKNLQKDIYKKSLDQLKSMNQAGIVFLLSIVTLAVLKDTINNMLIAGGIAVLVILVFIAVRSLVKKSSPE